MEARTTVRSHDLASGAAGVVAELASSGNKSVYVPDVAEPGRLLRRDSYPASPANPLEILRPHARRRTNC